MKTAIFYTGKFGSTQQYAQWLSEATGFSVFDLNQENPNPDDYDALILGSSIIVRKLTISKWLIANWNSIKEKPVLLFTVSGTKPGHPDLKKWLQDNLPQSIINKIKYIPLRGRLNLKTLPFLVRLTLKIGAMIEKDPNAKKRMRQGFNYMDKSSIAPILRWVKKLELVEKT